MALSHAGANARIWGYEASGNYFQVLGIHPALGRFFTPAEDQKPGANPYAVISYSGWQHRFRADPAVVRQTVKLNGLDYAILGVAPKGFIGTELLFVPEIWIPYRRRRRSNLATTGSTILTTGISGFLDGSSRAFHVAKRKVKSTA